MPDMLTEIADYLEAQGLSGGNSGWTTAVADLPTTPDQVVGVFEYPGNPPDPRVDIDHPGLQIRVRGPKQDYLAARAKLAAVQTLLHKFTGVLSGTYYIAILATGSPLPLGRDANDRPELTQNFIAWRSR